jgi:hypothetical protein
MMSRIASPSSSGVAGSCGAGEVADLGGVVAGLLVAGVLGVAEFAAGGVVDAAVVVPGGDLVADHLHDAEQLPGRVAGVPGDDPTGGLPPDRAHLVQPGDDQVVLAGELPVQQALAEARLVDDLLDPARRSRVGRTGRVRAKPERAFLRVRW